MIGDAQLRILRESNSTPWLTDLTRYCDDGNLEIDNNGAERSRRGVAVGRKNWMFYGSDHGGRTAPAVLTSLVATCKRLHIDPFAYLRDIFDCISSHPKSRLAELLPDQWKAGLPSPAPSLHLLTLPTLRDDRRKGPASAAL